MLATGAAGTIVGAEPVSAAVRMEEMYRHQRHIYDLTRKYYLLGRDRLITRLRAEPGDGILEIGSGTGRNLVCAAKHYPAVRCYGIDISAAMLASANAALVRHDLAARVIIAQGDATGFNAMRLFRRARFERVFISYSLSIIPEWRVALALAYSSLAAHGELHIVDFGRQDRLPQWFRGGLRRWLARFDVTPCDALESTLRSLARETSAEVAFESLYGSYAQYAVVKRPG